MNLIPGQSDSITIGGRVLTDVANLKILYGSALGTTSIRCTLREANGTAGYQVPVGKKFKVVAVKLMGTLSAAAAVTQALIGYADNDVGQSSSTAFTNGKFVADSGATFIGTGSINQNGHIELAYQFEIPAGKYPCAQVAATNFVTHQTMVYGYEVPA